MPFSGSSREGGNARIAPSLESGTAVAIYNSFKSARPFNAKHGFSGWGGARNRADRVSDGLSLNQATGIIEAAQYAAAIGLPFNRHVTIHWERAGVPDNRAAAATGRFLKLAGDWIAKRGPRLINNQRKSKRVARIAWAWVRENGDGKGSHVHILLHVPARLITGKNGASANGDNTPGKQRERLGNRPRRWLRSIAGARYRSGTIKTQRIGGTAHAAPDNTAVYQANLAAVVGYVLKGACPAAARALGLERLEPGGNIIGKRAATSQNIGAAARARKLQLMSCQCPLSTQNGHSPSAHFQPISDGRLIGSFSPCFTGSRFCICQERRKTIIAPQSINFRIDVSPPDQ